MESDIEADSDVNRKEKRPEAFVIMKILIMKLLQIKMKK